MNTPEDRTRKSADVCETLAGSEQAGRDMANAMRALGAVGDVALLTGAGEIWSRHALGRRDRSLVVLSFLSSLGRETELRTHLEGALNHGLEIDEIDEIFLQVSAYAGVSFGGPAAALFEEVLLKRGGERARTAPRDALALKAPEQRRADGLNVLKTLLGQPDLDTAETERQIQASQGAIGDLVMDYAFGDVWARPNLNRRDRSLVVISVLAALCMSHELEIHLHGALNHGVTETEIEEVMLTLVLYGGFPRAIDGLAIARKVFEGRTG